MHFSVCGGWRGQDFVVSELMDCCAEIVRKLLEKNVDVNKATDTEDNPMHGAVVGNEPAVVELLIRAGSYSLSERFITRLCKVLNFNFDLNLTF